MNEFIPGRLYELNTHYSIKLDNNEYRKKSRKYVRKNYKYHLILRYESRAITCDCKLCKNDYEYTFVVILSDSNKFPVGSIVSTWKRDWYMNNLKEIKNEK